MLHLKMSKKKIKCYTPLVSSELEPTQPTHAQKLIVQHGSLVKELGKPFRIFSKYVKVFDLYFVATQLSPDEKVLHGASVLYQYIDNTDSGFPDNILVYSKLKEVKATMIMFRDQDELEEHSEFFNEMEESDVTIQDLEAEETRPGSIAPFEFDEALEECFHLVTQGYVLAYPEVFGLYHGSAVSMMMDCARGGYFVKIPKHYPPNAWYRYHDETCEYAPCMIIEYLYWAMTTILGAQKYRYCEVGNEWKPCTKKEIIKTDNPIYSLLTNPYYKLPTRLPVPVAGMPLYVNKMTCVPSGKMASSSQMTCCGCLGDRPKKIKNKLLKIFKL